VTRIIGGVASGRRLATPPGASTRPTSDRVREALFSSLESAVGALTGLRFLDLYAGSGAIGLEARSRGAVGVTCVEQDRRTAGVVRSNARALGFDDVEVLVSSVGRALATPPGAPYDLVFSDPPYPLADTSVAADLSALVRGGWLTAASVVVVERSSRSPGPVWPEGLVRDRSRRYGETTLWYGHAT
jgi:16S rRNA (guanine966-N2)-methyltransferase